MHTVVVDFETHFGTGYTLKSLPSPLYITDPRFEVIGAAIKFDSEPEVFVKQPDLEEVLRAIPWGKSIFIAHNAAFDGAIARWHYKIPKPMAYVCTYYLSRALYAHTDGGVSLDAMGARIGIRKHDGGALMAMRNMRYADIDWTSQSSVDYREYAKQDAAVSYAIFQLLRHIVPLREQVIMSQLLEAFIEPELVLDCDLLDQYEESARREREELEEYIGMSIESLRSPATVASLLSARGVHLETKSTPAGNVIPAISKADLSFTRLESHPDPMVRAIVTARFRAMSNLEGTRSAVFRQISQRLGSVPVPLLYSGAHTHRFSGRDRMNLQNLPRSGPLRKSLMARPGRRLVVVDAAQIEARILAWLAGEYELCAQFGRGDDVYSRFAEKIYGYPVNKTDTPEERRVGKIGVLSLGYGAGAAKFEWMLGSQGADANSDFAAQVVRTYRTTYPGVPALWRQGDRVLEQMMRPGASGRWCACEVEHEALVLPSGLRLHYKNLRSEVVTRAWGPSTQYLYDQPTFSGNTSPCGIWGGTLVENVTQALARIVITEAMCDLDEIARERGWRFVLQVHDELVYSVPEEDADVALAVLIFLMSRTPRWADNRLQLAAEGSTAVRYGDAK